MSSSQSENSSESAGEEQRLKEAAIDCSSVLQAASDNRIHPDDPEVLTPRTDPVGSSSKKTLNPAILRPSLRPTLTLPEDENDLQTTPGFRSHIAKKLDKFLDKSLEVVDTPTGRNENESGSGIWNEENGDFRLFSTSVPEDLTSTFSTQKRVRPPSSSSSEDEERFLACAVSGDDILTGGGINSLVTRSRLTSPECSKTSPPDKTKKMKKKAKQNGGISDSSSNVSKNTTKFKKKENHKKTAEDMVENTDCSLPGRQEIGTEKQRKKKKRHTKEMSVS